MYLVKLFGGASIEGPNGVVTGKAARRHALALLALLALSHSRRLSRDKLIAYLWPESGSSHARNLLNQSVHALRQTLGGEAIRSEGDELTLDPEAVSCDVWSFQAALASGDAERAVDLYVGPFLDGFFPADAVELERWIDGEREGLRRAYLKALEQLAEGAAARDDREGAVEWWRRLAAEDPANSGVVMSFMRALEWAGDRVGAIREADAHARLLTEEFDAVPSPGVLALAERMRTQPISPTGATARPAAVVGTGAAREPVLATPPREPARAPVNRRSSRHAEQEEDSLPVVDHPEREPQPAGDLAAEDTSTIGGGASRRLTWRKTVAGGVSLFALLGLATAGYVAMRAFGIGPLGTLITRGILEERDVIVLADFEDHAGDPTLALTVTEALRVDLGQSPVVGVAEPDYVGRVLERMEKDPDASVSYEVAREAAIREGFKAVVTGKISRVGSRYVLSARLVAAETGEELYSSRETAPELNAIIPAIDRLSARLRRKIGESLRTIRDSPPLSQARTASLEALRLQTGALQANARGEFEQALDLLNRAIEIDTLFTEAYRLRSSVLGNVGINRAQMVADAMRAHELRHRLPLWERYWVEGRYHDRRGDSERVIEAYRSLLKLKDHPGAVQDLGLTYEGLRHYARAEELYRRRLEMDSLSGNSWTTLSRVQFNLGKFDEAQETLRQFESKLPQHSAIPLARARYASARGDYDAAEVHLRNWIKRYGPNLLRQAYFSQFMGRLAQVQGKLAEAEDLFIDAMAAYDERGLASKYLETGIELARLHVRFLGDTAKALEAMSAALEKHPLISIEPFERPYLFLAELYAIAGQPEGARQLLAEWDTAVPPDLRRPQEAMRRGASAVVALVEGHADDAVTESRLAYERDGCPDCRYPLLGRAYELAGQPDSAVTLYERYLTTPFFGRTIAGYEPHFFSEPYWLAMVYERLGALYEQRGDAARAIRYYGKLVELWRDADPELQPRVRAARRAMEGLSSDQ